MRMLLLGLTLLFTALTMNVTLATRIKDVTTIAGVRENQLIGYGLVVGLDGTGDKTSQAPFTQQTFKNMLLQFGIKIPLGLSFELKNVAAVAVSANLHPFAKIGQRMDVTVLSLGNATSLRGGELIMTPLRGADNRVYAMAQGSVIVSGFGAQGSDGSKVTVNVTSSGRIPNGATVENTINAPFAKNGIVTFQLAQADFTSAEKISKIINRSFNRNIAVPIDAGSVNVNLRHLAGASDRARVLAYDYKNEGVSEEYIHEQVGQSSSIYIPYISKIENLMLDPETSYARIIVNSRTGTIVMDQNIIISPVAVSHGNLSVVVSEHPYVSQPNAFSNGKTVKGNASTINVTQSQNRAFVFSAGTTLQDLVDEINRVGAAPGDLIAILEAVKAAGALHADLQVI